MVRERLRLLFCGTPEFAVPTLDALAEAGHDLQLVLTQPDRPAGRGMQLLAPPVKQWAARHNIPVDQPARIRDNQPLRDRLTALRPDAIVVVAYGRIVPPWMLGLPPLGCLNLHGSLLPRYRGAAPIQWAVANGDRVTGVTTMLLEEGLDTGPTLERATLPIPPEATAAALFPVLARLGAPLVVSSLHGLAAGTLTPQPQNNAESTLAPLLTRDDGRIDWARPAAETLNRWRGFQPWPGAWTMLGDRKFTVTHMALPPPSLAALGGKPGTLGWEGGHLYGVCGQGTAVVLLEVQLEGKRALPAADFLRGYPQLPGSVLG